MLPVTLPRDQVETLIEDVTINPGSKFTVNLEEQQVIRANGEIFTFEIDSFKKHCLFNGLDKIGLTLEKEDKIAAFEKVRSEKYPWLDGASSTVPEEVPMYPDAEYWKR